MNLFSKATLPVFCYLFFLLVSCESHEQKADDAFDEMKKEKLKPKDSTLIVTEKREAPIVKETEKKIDAPDEWTKFRSDIEKKMAINDSKIKSLKATPNLSSKLLKNLVSIEAENVALYKQMDEFHEEGRIRWETFKSLVNHNVNEIGIEIKDLSATTKK